MFLGTRVPAEEVDDDDWDTTPVARGPSLSREDEQFIDLLVGESDSETETDDREDDTSVSEASTERSENRSEEEIPSLGELATDHLTRATTFLGRSVRRVSGSFTLYPSALVHTRERASSLIGETVQQTKALSNTILDMTVNRAMRLSSEAINVANEKTRATLSSAGAALSPPRVEHENGRVKHLPSALTERITHNLPDLSRLVLHANEVRQPLFSSDLVFCAKCCFVCSIPALQPPSRLRRAVALAQTLRSATCICMGGMSMMMAWQRLPTAPPCVGCVS